MQKDLESRSEKYALASPDHILVATDLTDMAYLVPYVVAQAEATGPASRWCTPFPLPNSWPAILR